VGSGAFNVLASLSTSAATHQHLNEMLYIRTPTRSTQRSSVRSDGPPEDAPIVLQSSAHECLRRNPWVDDAAIGPEMLIFIECVIRFDHQWWNTSMHAEPLSENRHVKFQDDMAIDTIKVR
jgi:hypothetical protein